jgi:hypothetical protein
MSEIKYKGFRIQKVYTIIGNDGEGYDYQFTLKDAKRVIDEKGEKK